MKNIIKALLIVMTLVLVLVAFSSCELACVHEGGEATCSEAGVCTICGEAYIPALGHKTGFVPGLDATCTEGGYTASSYCITCGEVFIPSTDIDPVGHSMVFSKTESVAPTYKENGVKVYVCERGCGYSEEEVDPMLVAELPEAVVTPVENEDLTFALNFGIDGISIVDGELVIDSTILSNEYLEAVIEKYGNYYVDYVLTIEGLTSEKVVFNADGNADGYLGGQYDAWSENWVYVPFEDTAINNNGSLYIMQTAAEMMGQSGLRYTLAEIVSVVVDFDCGVYFTPEFLAANPDMVVTLELIVFTEVDGEIADRHVLAENVFTVPVAE